MLPGDQHVHTQWSADAPNGSMRDACVRAVELGLPAATFTDHADLTTLVVSDEAAAYIAAIGGRVTGVYVPPPLDVAGYLDCVEQCRREFGRLRIRAGVELGDPHLYPVDEGGTAVSFGSDAHDPVSIGREFTAAAAMAGAAGFAPGGGESGLWVRR